MQEPHDHWNRIRTAPRDGTTVLVAVHASEQGPAQVDVVRWVVPDMAADETWVATDSDRDVTVTYSDGELSGWMPLPDGIAAADIRAMSPDEIVHSSRDGETDGSAI